MTKIKILNTDCKEIDCLSIKHDLQGIQYNESMIYKVLIALFSNMNRTRYFHYKNVSGLNVSTRKIRAQKRTGKSRQGCAREIHMRGGAVKFGFSGNKLKDQSRRFKAYKFINKKERKLAVLQIFSNKFQFNKIFIFNTLNEIKKTKEAIIQLNNIKVEKPLFIYGEKGISFAYNNISKANISNIDSLNIYKMLQSQEIIFDLCAFNKFINKNI